MNWLYAALFAAFFNSLMDFFTKLSSGKIHDSLGATMICLFAAVPTVFATLYAAANHQAINVSKGGLIYSAIAGLTVGVATIFTFKMYMSGANLSVAVPILRVGIILFASLMGIFILKEGINLKLMSGFILSLVGLYLIVQAKG